MIDLEFPTDDPSKLPTTLELPIGDIELVVKSWKIDKTKPTNELSDADRAAGKVGNRKTVNIQFVVDKPEAFRGLPHTKVFYIGSNEDPEAKKTSTWERNAVQLMSMFKEAGVHVGKGTRLTESLEASKEQHIGASVALGKGTAQFAARPEIKSFWKPGKKDIRVARPADEVIVSAKEYHNED